MACWARASVKLPAGVGGGHVWTTQVALDLSSMSASTWHLFHPILTAQHLLPGNAFSEYKQPDRSPIRGKKITADAKIQFVPHIHQRPKNNSRKLFQLREYTDPDKKIDICKKIVVRQVSVHQGKTQIPRGLIREYREQRAVSRGGTYDYVAESNQQHLAQNSFMSLFETGRTGSPPGASAGPPGERCPRPANPCVRGSTCCHAPAPSHGKQKHTPALCFPAGGCILSNQTESGKSNPGCFAKQ